MALASAFRDLVLHPLLTAMRPGSVLIEQFGEDDGFACWVMEQAPDALIHVADPRPGFDPLPRRSVHRDRVVLHRARAAVALGLIAVPELIVLAGDANWYTVHAALTAAREQAGRLGRFFPVCLLAGAGWPYGRRDRYADPRAIPEPYRHEYETAGVRPGQAALAGGGGLYPERVHARAEHAPHNGVLTAIEEFLANWPGGAEARPRLQVLPMLEGLAILWPAAAPAAVADWTQSVRMGSAARELASLAEVARSEAALEIAELRRALDGERVRNDALRAALIEKRGLRLGAREAEASPGWGARAWRRLRRELGPRRDPAAEAWAADLAAVRRSCVFDADWYRLTYTDVAQAGVDPVEHFLAHGLEERRDPGPHFSIDWYLQAYPDVAEAGVNPLLHYLREGAAEGRDPGPTFSTREYVAAHPDLAGQNPLEHWIRRASGGPGSARDPLGP